MGIQKAHWAFGKPIETTLNSSKMKDYYVQQQLHNQCSFTHVIRKK